MSVMSVPKSYAVLMGIEGYSWGKKTMQEIKKGLGLEEGGDEGSDEEKREGERRKKAGEERMNSARLDGSNGGEKGVSVQPNGVENEREAEG